MAAVAQTKGRAARHLARDHALVRRDQRGLRRNGHLVLARAIFGKEGVGLGVRRTDRRDEHLAERALAPERAQTIGVARQVLDAGIDELLLEGGEQMETACLFQRGGSAAQERAHTALPRAAVSVADIAEEEMLRGRAVAEVHMHFGGRIRHDHEVAARSERRVEDRPEAGLHQVGVSPADAGLSPRRQFACRKALAANEPRDIASPDENQLFAQHGAPSGR